MQKILIIQTAFIGDVILATALIENLHKQFPNAQLDFLLRKGNEALLDEHPKLNKVIVWNKKEKYKSLLKIIKEVRKEKYDLIICVQRFLNAGLITVLSGAKYTVGFHSNPLSFLFSKKIKHIIGTGKHEVDRNNELIEQWVEVAVRKPKLYPLEKHYAKVKTLQQEPYLVMAPSSVWFTKQLPKEKWIELINYHLNEKIFLIGAPSDNNLCTEIIEKSQHKNIESLCGKLTLLESAALIENAKMNYVNDSAPLHICSAMNAKVTAFFCSTLPSFGFTPLSDNSIVKQIDYNLYCRPCGLHGKKFCKEKHFKCGYEIYVKD